MTGSFAVGGGLTAGTKSVISVHSKRLAEDVTYVYDRQILFTNKIQFQRSRIEDLAFRIAKATKELVSFVRKSLMARYVRTARNVVPGKEVPVLVSIVLCCCLGRPVIT